MNSINKIATILLLPLLISLTGCLEEKVETIINSDGSCVRTISMKLQSKTVPENKESEELKPHETFEFMGGRIQAKELIYNGKRGEFNYCVVRVSVWRSCLPAWPWL